VSNSPMQRVIHCVTANASAGGAFFPTAEPIAERTRARIRMLLNNERVEALTGLKAQAWIEGTVLRASPRGFAVSFEDKYRITPVRSQ
jgi:hypothetical protein